MQSDAGAGGGAHRKGPHNGDKCAAAADAGGYAARHDRRWTAHGESWAGAADGSGHVLEDQAGGPRGEGRGPVGAVDREDDGAARTGPRRRADQADRAGREYEGGGGGATEVLGDEGVFEAEGGDAA